MMYQCKMCLEYKPSEEVSQIDDICFECKIKMYEEAMAEHRENIIGKDYR